MAFGAALAGIYAREGLCARIAHQSACRDHQRRILARVGAPVRIAAIGLALGRARAHTCAYLSVNWRVLTSRARAHIRAMRVTKGTESLPRTHMRAFGMR
jgi:hypothetical protein